MAAETHNALAIESYLKLLLAFRSLPQTHRSRTFMEISGYPHYENVATNILAFYFDPAAEHGLGDLLVSAFLQMAGFKDVPTVEHVQLHREFGTEERNRIDLILDGESFTIGIENKIFHWLANDLEDYGEVIDRHGQSKSLVIKAVLGLHPVEDKALLKGGFSSYTYGQLWKQVRSMLGHYISNADPKWVSHLIDFMATTTNLAGENMELQKTDKFFIEHNEIIEKMLTERDAFLGRLNQKVSTLCTMMKEATASALLNGEPWVYAGSCVVLDLYFANCYAIAFDLYLRPSGWELQLFGRNKKSGAYLERLLGQRTLKTRAANAPLNGNRHIMQTWPIDADLGVMRDALCSWIDAVDQAVKTASS